MKRFSKYIINKQINFEGLLYKIIILTYILKINFRQKIKKLKQKVK